MESTGSSKELIKSILIMAGIPLAFSVVCSLIAKVRDRKISSLQDQIQESESDSMCDDDQDYLDNTRDVNRLKDQIFTLRSKIEELQELEREIEDKFFRFIDLKDQEYALMEVQNSLLIEKERAEFLEKEVFSMEVENKKFDEMVVEYLKSLEELESSRFENGLLRRRVKNLLKKTKESSRLIRKQNNKFEVQEVELKRKEIAITGLDTEVKELRAVINNLWDEKNELLKKLETAEKEVSSKAEEEKILKENYNKVVKELEHLQKNRAAELKELIYLRWCHACLRHELARRNQIEEESKRENEKTDELGTALGEDVSPEECAGHESDNESVTHHDEPFFGPSQRHSKRRWLVRKFKKWVESSEKHHEAKCFGTQSVVDEKEERNEAARRSFSSV